MIDGEQGSALRMGNKVNIARHSVGCVECTKKLSRTVSKHTHLGLRKHVLCLSASVGRLHDVWKQIFFDDYSCPVDRGDESTTLDLERYQFISPVY
jgi:hypothetical protein